MEFRILGPLEVLDEGREVALGGSKQRALLAVLVLHANETLSTDRLIDELWGEHPPSTASKTVQVHVSRLRKALPGGDDLVVTRDRGYRLRVEPDRIDSHRFERMLDEGRSELAAGRPPEAASALGRALALWRGAPLADLAYEPFAQGEIGRLGDLHAAAVELQIEAKLALGRHAEVVGQLESLIAEHPYRERLRAQLMLALYRCERQADALQAYQDARTALVDELGIEPGERLRRLEAAILAQDPALAWLEPVAEPRSPPPAPAPRGAAAPEPLPARSVRRLVSIVFADLAGSTGLAERLDPESMHDLLDRFTQSCAAVIQSHGGSVEGFIGDAVVGVFGLSELHEDDALRAVRSAVEMRAAGEELSARLDRERGVAIEIKFGVESGEVFLGSGASRSPFAAGDAYNVAARLEGIASPGEIILGERLHPLVRHAVRAEPLESVALKGRAAEVRPWRLLGLAEDELVPPRSQFVNRTREMAELRAALERVRSEEACHALTVAGPAGIGKSRLVRELVDQLEDVAVLVGRCVSYGEGVTYRPLAEIVRQLGGDEPRARIEELLDGDESMARLILAAVGLADGPAQADETFWAVRRLLERVASERPLVVVVEDVHWAEPTLLDLLDYVLAFSSAHPVLLVPIARAEFLEARPAWAAPLANRSLLTLDALSDGDARELIDAAGGGIGSRTAAQIVDTAEGNPLFLEQLVAVDAEDGQSALPSSIQAVLAARIEHLEPGERALLEHASVQGRSFYVGAVEELLPEGERAAIPTDLVALVRKQLIRADRPELPGEDAFRFAHALIREAAYQGLPRRRRADLHEHAAAWLAGRSGARDETIGYHLGEACRQLAELGEHGERERALAASAAKRLSAAADAARLRGDLPASASLLERATTLLERDEPARNLLLPRLAAALLDAGRLEDANRVLDEARGDRWLEARADVERQLVRLQSDSGATRDGTEAIVEAALEELEPRADDIGQCRALCLRALQAWVEGRATDADGAWSRAAEHARRAGDQATLFEILDWRAAAALFGPTPVPEAIARCREIYEEVRISPVAGALTSRPLAALHAMAGDFDEARRLIASADEILGEIGGLQAAITHQEALVERLAGDPAAAAARLRAGYDSLEEMGERALLASTAAWLAQALLADGLSDEAERFCRVAEEAAPDGDLTAQLGWRGVRARLLAAEGRMDEAEARAVEAVALAERMEFPTLHADALRDLAEVLQEAGRPEEAEVAARAALDLYRRKGVSPTIGGIRDQVQ